METSFFKPLADLGIPGIWTLSIQVPKSGPTTVSILFRPETCGDNAHKIVQPILLKGEPGEIDTGFFSAITEPVATAAGLFVNMESHLKTVESARTSAKMTTDQKKVKDTPATETSEGPRETAPAGHSKEEKRKVWDEVMARIDELKGHMKYQEAIDILPKADDYPEKKDELEKLEKQLRQWLSQFTLFAAQD